MIFSIGTFNVRGLTKEEKQEHLARDIENHNVDVCCLQETKIASGLNCNIGEKSHQLVSFKTECKHYGNGFVVNNKWKNNVHRCWRVSDRVSVLQLTTKNKTYECIQTDDINLKLQVKKCYKVKSHTNNKVTISTAKIKNCISIINVYAPTTERVKKDSAELDQMYTEIGEPITKLKNDEKTKTSPLLLAGDFNSKVGISQGEACLGSFSRGRRNTSGQALIDFCNIHNLFISNSSFKHPAKHITTWQQIRVNKAS